MRKAVQIREIIQNEYPEYQFSSDKFQKFNDLLVLLEKWNQQFNLTSIRDFDQMIEKHILDSMAFFNLFPPKNNNQIFSGKIIDIGSGAGLPGAVVSILNPESNIISIDKSSKKIKFQEILKQELQLENFHPLNIHLTQIYNIPEHQNSYTFILARAFDQIKGLFENGVKLLSPKGHLILWKGKKWQEELDQTPESLKNQYLLKKSATYQFGDGRFGGTILLFQKK